MHKIFQALESAKDILRKQLSESKFRMRCKTLRPDSLNLDGNVFSASMWDTIFTGKMFLASIV